MYERTYAYKECVCMNVHTIIYICICIKCLDPCTEYNAI